MPEPRVFRNRVWESGTKYNRARLVDRNGNILVQGDFTGTVLTQVYDKAGADVDDAVYSNTAAIGDVIFNTLQTWDVDTVGYNFEVAITSNDVTMDGGHTYRACHRITHSSEGVYAIVFEMKAEPELGA